MVRLLRISLDILVTSGVPIILWSILGIIIDKDLINIFSLTYPIQFIVSILKSLFGTGANISGYKDGNKNSINTGIIVGSIVGIVVFAILALNMDTYITFMKMDVDKYRIFGTYAVMQMLLQLILYLILSKLHYKNENKKANKISITFNILNFISLIGISIFTKNQIYIVTFSLIIMIIYTLYILMKNLDKSKISINILQCIKYDSVELTSSITFFVIYLFGLSNAFQYGENFVLAISFAALVTDIQWDVAHSISIVSKIDITKGVFKYKEHIKNAYKLVVMLVISTTAMSILLYNQYMPQIDLTIIFILFDAVSLCIYPIYRIKTCYLQLEYSAIKTTINKQIADISRVIMSFLPTPFCTGIGLIMSVIYQLIYTKILWRHIDKNKIYEDL